MMPLYFAELRRRASAPTSSRWTATSSASTRRGSGRQEIFERFDLRPLLPSLTMPTLVITGEQDFITGPACGGGARRGHPGGRDGRAAGCRPHDLRRGSRAVPRGRALVPRRRSPRLIEQAVEAIRDGRPVVLPTDTVYGLCGSTRTSRKSAGELYRLKQRPAGQPLALLAKDVEALLELVPELPRAALEALLPGAVHAGAAEPRAALPLADGLGAGDDRRARAEADRARGRGAGAGRRGRGHEREPARRPGGPDARGRPGGDPRRRGRRRRRRRAPRHAVDRARPDRATSRGSCGRAPSPAAEALERAAAAFGR